MEAGVQGHPRLVWGQPRVHDNLPQGKRQIGASVLLAIFQLLKSYILLVILVPMQKVLLGVMGLHFVLFENHRTHLAAAVLYGRGVGLCSFIKLLSRQLDWLHVPSIVPGKSAPDQRFPLILSPRIP